MKKGMAWLAGILGAHFGGATVWGSTVTETVTEITVTEECWEEEFTGTEAETQQWLAQQERKKEEEKLQEEREEVPVTEEIVVIEEETAAEEAVTEETVIEEAAEDAQAEEERHTADTNPPVIEILGILPVSDGSVPLRPVIRVTDEKIEERKIEITLKTGKEHIRPMTAVYEKKGNCLTGSLEEIHKDGAYRLTVTAQDEAGNKSVDGCFFTVNRSGTSFFHGEEYEKSGGKELLVRLENKDDVKILSCMVNGQEADYRWRSGGIAVSGDMLKPGDNVIALETMDRAGNLSVMEPWKVRCVK